MLKNLNLSLIEKLTLVILFLFALSVFNLAGPILACLFIISFVFLMKGKATIDQSVAVLFFFSVIYFITYIFFWDYGIKEIIIYLIAPWASYLFGFSIVSKSKNKNMFTMVVIILIFGFFVHGILNLYMTIEHFGFESGYRMSIDFWRREEISVTGCSLYYVPLMGLSTGYLFAGTKRNLKIWSIVALAIGLFANITYINRTAIYMMAILTVIGVVNVFLQKKEGYKNAFALVTLVVVVVIVLGFDVYGIRTSILGFEVINRINGSEVGRFEVWFDFLSSDWWRYPFGGEQATFGYGFAHNLWLDILYSVGIIPFVLFLFFTIKAISTVKMFYEQNKKERLIYVFMMLAMVISSFVEPVIYANSYFFLIMIMIVGAMKGQINRQDKSI